MDWNWDFPKPEEDPKYQRDYDTMFGKGAFERDFIQKKKENQNEYYTEPVTALIPEYRLDRKFYWDHGRSVGVVNIKGKFVGVACLAAKEVTDKENYIRKFGFDFRRDIQWHGISELLGHLSRSPLFKAVLVTSSKVPFELKPDIPGQWHGRLKWINRNFNHHKEILDTIRGEVKSARWLGGFPVAKELLNRQKAEIANTSKFLNHKRSLESQMKEHMKPYHHIKDNLFTACLLFYVYTSQFDNLETALQEIIRKKSNTKTEITMAYHVKCIDVEDADVVFTGFVPSPDLLATYGGIAASDQVAGFKPDDDVGIALRKMFSLTLELPKDEFAIEEKIHMPEENEVSLEGEGKAFVGHVVSSVVKRKVTRQKVFFPLNTLVKHGIITGSTGKGKTYFAMHLARQAAKQGVKCLVLDPHGTFKFLPKHKNIEIAYVNSASKIIEILEKQYYEALRQPIQTKANLRKLIIVDEVSSGKFGSRVKQIMQRLDRLFAETRKFGYGVILICQYATESRGISAAARENAETLFIFRKKTMNELERIKTLKHPSLNLLPYLEEGFFMIYSEDFHPEPFFVKVPRIDSLLVKREVYTNLNDDDGSDDEEKPMITMRSTLPETEEKGVDTHNHSNHNEEQAVCKRCNHSWSPRKSLDQIKECPNCKSRDWK